MPFLAHAVEIEDPYDLTYMSGKHFITPSLIFINSIYFIIHCEEKSHYLSCFELTVIKQVIVFLLVTGLQGSCTTVCKPENADYDNVLTYIADFSIKSL